MGHRYQPIQKQTQRRGSKPARSYKRLKFGVPRQVRRGAKVAHQAPYLPPEDWFEPTDEGDLDFWVVEREAGEGYRHIVTEDEIRQRLSLLPEDFIRPLDVVCLSGITRKKSRYPLYGMQWGSTIYLYPMDERLQEFFHRPPNPSQLVEAKMFGGVWTQPESRLWCLEWTEANLRDYYLNNVLIHELGHLLDERNTSVTDRERYAEWFAIHYGYKPSRTLLKDYPKARSKRRHHAS